MKKVLTYCLVMLLLSLSVGVWLLSVPVANFVKSRAKSEIEQGANTLHLQLRPGEFKRIGADELMIGDELYDVISEHRKGGFIEFVVYRDIFEKYFLHFLLVNSSMLDLSEDESTPLKTIVENVLRLEFCLTPGYVFNQMVPFRRLLTRTSSSTIMLTSPVVPVLLPPPQIQ